MYCASKLKIALAKIPTRLIPKPMPMLFSGPGRVNDIPGLLEMYRLRRVLLVAGKTLLSKGMLDEMMAGVAQKGISITLFDRVQPDPTFETVRQGLVLCRADNCDCVVAVGGGSVLDAAKAIAAGATSSRPPEQLRGLCKVKNERLPFFAVPTTAGTGSETTLVAVVSDSQTHRKSTIIDPQLLPDAAVLDPELTVSLPPSVTAATAMDALTHAIEAYVSTYATPRTDTLCCIAVKLIFENAALACKQPDNLAARQALLLASFYAGMAFTQTYVGYVHAFSHSIGGRYGIAHGLANAVILPHVMQAYLPVCQLRFAQLAQWAGVGGGEKSPEQQARNFIRAVRHLARDIGIPPRLDAFPANGIPAVVTEAFQECHGTYPVPLYFTRTQALLLLRKVAAR